MKIDAVYIVCYRHDVEFTRVLVASIRHWYPVIPIYLVKDFYYGPFDTGEIEKYWNVGVFKTERKALGWGFGKWEPIFQKARQRFLVLDSDIVFAGPVLEELEKHGEDFIVQREEPSDDFVKSHYFDLEKLKQVDPEFRFPGFTFNGGQLVATSGLIRREDFEPWLYWKEPPVMRRPDIFKMGDQGLTNYFLMKKAQRGEITLGRHRMMEIPTTMVVKNIKIAELDFKSPYPLLIHWCGLKRPFMRQMERADILLYFQDLYYAKVPLWRLKRWFRGSYELISFWKSKVRLMCRRIGGVRGLLVSNDSNDKGAT